MTFFNNTNPYELQGEHFSPKGVQFHCI